MRKLLFIALIIFTGMNLHAQYPFNNAGIFYMPAPGPEKYYADKNDDDGSDTHSWARYQLQTGVMFNSLNGFNSVSTWLSPSVLLPVNSKLAINVGGTYINSFNPGDLNESGESGRASDFIMNVSGIYSVNEKMTVYGQFSKSLMDEGLFGRDGFESMTLGMDYTPLPGVRIGASITTTNGLNPYMMQQGYMPYHMNRGYMPGYYRPYY
ncbi:MAG: hypothetical protein R6V34_07610 [Bacteroidales bacterium]